MPISSTSPPHIPSPRRPRPARLLEIEPAAARPARKGRGARVNPTGRFEKARLEPILDPDLQPAPSETLSSAFSASPAEAAEAVGAAASDSSTSGTLRTQMLPDPSRTAITYNKSPDIPFDASLNPYRGCEHGCAYCYARPTHEYLGYSAGLDFESKILVKEGAPELLRRELAAKRWRPQPVAISGVTDAYQPIEKRLGLTRRCLEVFVEFRNPVLVITKNALVTRDIDLFRQLAEQQAISISISLTTLDGARQRALEPRASSPGERLRAIEKLAEAGIPTGVMVAPIIPGLTDHEMPALLAAAAAAGATHAGHIVLRLPHGLRDLFDDWLMTHAPLRREKVLHRLEAMRGGRLNDPRFGSRMTGSGPFASQIGDVFRLLARKHGLDRPPPPLSVAAFQVPAGAPTGGGRGAGAQLSLGL